ncbi:MAG: ABC transporter substrate-binding protein [Candidatus Scatomorpha sp.]|jgi:branched-chain amino acid transport system substrate-binding protein
MKMKKLLSILLALCLVLGLAACGSTDAGGDDASDASEAPSGGSSGDTLKIGLIGPMTGGLAAYGNSMREGFELTIAQINEAGGILGKQVEMVVADDQGTDTECVNAFNSLVSQGIKIIVGSATSGCTSAITGLANEEGVILITPSATADSITTEDDYVFRSCFRDSLQGDIAAAYVASMGYTKVGTIECSADTYSMGLVASFTAACEQRGIEIVAAESTATMDAQDFTNQWAAMVSAGAELVYAIYYYDAVGPFLIPQARAAGYTGAIMGADGFDGTLDYISEGTDLTAFNDVFWTNHYDPSDPSEATAAFVDAYEAEYGTAPMSFAALTHDCLLIVQTAIETAGTADDIAAVRDAMADTSVVYDGVTGTFSLDESGTPTKGGAIIEFYLGEVTDEETGEAIPTVMQRLETTITADELT